MSGGKQRSGVWVRVLLAFGLMSAVIALAVLARGAALAEPGQTAGTLEATHFSGALPEPETEGTALIQWGGGSLYQLTARLAVNGCDLNLLWVYDTTQRRYTAGYTFDGPSFLNNTFNSLYKDNIPPSIIWIKCIDMINHVYGYPLLSDSEKAWVDSQPKGAAYSNPNHTAQGNYCGDHWLEEIAAKVLPILPTQQNICITKGTGGLSGLFNFHSSIKYYSGSWYYKLRPAVSVNAPIGQERSVTATKIEIHESCHMNQNWHTFEHSSNQDTLEDWSQNTKYLNGKRLTNSSPTSFWENTLAAREFADILGFEFNEEEGWSLPEGSVFASFSPYYTDNPLELSAELCAGYLLSFSDIRAGNLPPKALYGHYKPYLTEEVIAWLEKYVFVLPESRLAR